MAQQTSDFDGTWVLRLDGQNIFKLTLATERGAVTGSLTKPKKLVIAQDGDVTAIGPDQVTLPAPVADLDAVRVRRRKVLYGLINEYAQAA